MEHDKPESAAWQCHSRHWVKRPLASLVSRDWIRVPEITQAVCSLNLIRPLQQDHPYANEPFEMRLCGFVNLITHQKGQSSPTLFYHLLIEASSSSLGGSLEQVE